MVARPGKDRPARRARTKMDLLYVGRHLLGRLREHHASHRTFHQMGRLFSSPAARRLFVRYVARTGRFPRRVAVETTNRCNARCSICPHSRMTRPKTVMDWDLFRAIIDQCAERRDQLDVMTFSNSGEPLLDPLINERIAYAKGRGIREVFLSTNSSLLNTLRGLGLLESGLDVLTVCLDGWSAGTYGRIRDGLEFEQVRDALLSFLDAAGSAPRRPKIILQILRTPFNAHEIPAVRKELAPQVDLVRLLPVFDWGGELTRRRGPSVVNYRYKMPCSHVFSKFVALADGRAVSCCLDFDGRNVVGDLRSQTIEEIWNGEPLAGMRRQAFAGDLSNWEACAECATWGW